MVKHNLSQHMTYVS